jgi:hypothetical protein
MKFVPFVRVVATTRLVGAIFLFGVVVWSAPTVGAVAAGAAGADQTLPAIAFDGTNYMVVWQDGRTGTYPDIYCARVSSSGVVLDPGGIAISTAEGYQGAPAIAFDGTNYLVVWQDFRSGLNYKIYGARVSKSGVVLDPGGIVICTVTGNQVAPAIAFDGTDYMVVWQDLRNVPSDIYGARVSKAGTVLDPDGIAVSTAVNPQSYPAIAFDGTNYLVAWNDERNSSHYDLYCARVSKSGVVLDPDGVAISKAAKRQGFPAIAFDGTNYMVVWQDDRSGFYDIYGSRVNTSGAVLDAGGIAVSTAASDQSYPAIAFDGTNYFAVWQDGRGGDYDIYGARASTSGVVLDPGGFTDLAFVSASVAVENDCVVLSWQMVVEVSSSSLVVKRADSPGGEFLTVAEPVSSESLLSFSCTDCSVLPGKTYWYQIVLADPSGQRVYGPIEVRVGSVPTAYRAYQSYPNPFNPACTIRYEIPRAGKITLIVFDLNGSIVRTLVDRWEEPGVHSEVWDGKRDDGTALASGVYFYRLEAGDFVGIRKMVLLQ